MTVSIIISSADREAAFGGDTDEELANVDIDASIEKLDRMTLALVRETFPSFSVELGSGLHVYPEDHSQEACIVHAIAADAGYIHGRGEWIVYR
jgi:hypothetical protein